MIADAVELQDPYTADHANEVAELTVRVGERLGIDGAELDRLRYGALLHDVGKIGVPGELLRKPGPLSPNERRRMDAHTAIGARMLERIPFLAPVAPSSAPPTSATTAAATPTGSPASRSREER